MFCELTTKRMSAITFLNLSSICFTPSVFLSNLPLNMGCRNSRSHPILSFSVVIRHYLRKSCEQELISFESFNGFDSIIVIS